MAIQKTTWLKKSLSWIMAFAMLLSMCSGYIKNVSADDNGKSVTNGGVTINTTDENFSADSFTLDVKTAEEGFHDFVKNESNVFSNTSLMQGNNGFSVKITLQNGGSAVDYEGTLNVSYTLPDSWDLSHGVTVEAVTSSSMGTLEFDAASELTSVIEGNKVTFTMDYDSVSDEDKTRLLIMENSYAADLSNLTDGVYDIGLTMLSNVAKRSLSMASNTLDFDNSKYIVKGEKRYLYLKFNKGVVMFMPAFANKIYAINVEANKNGVGTHTLKGMTPGMTISYYDTQEVLDFSFDTIKNGLGGAMGDTDEEIQKTVDTNILVNGVKYIDYVVLDVTESMQDNGCYLIGFCSDVMDSLYNGVNGSDTGFNTTNLMVSNPVKNTSLNTDDLLPAAGSVNRSKLDEIFETYMNYFGATNNTIRHIFTNESYNTYYVPAWQQLYQAYTYVNATQEDVDAALKAAEEAFAKLEYCKCSETPNARGSLIGIINRYKRLDPALYTSASYNALSELVPAAQEIYDLKTEAYNKDVVEQYYILNAAYEALELKATDYSALQAAVDEAKAIDTTEYTKKTVEALNEAVAAGEKMLEEQDSSDSAIAQQIQAISDAKAALSKYDVLEDGIYKADVEMLKVNRSEPSMASGAINTTIKIEVIDGVYYATLDFKGMIISNQLGYLSKLWYYADGYEYNNYGEPQGDLIDAEVLSTQKNADGSDIIDAYNDSSSLYPDLVKIQLVETALADKEGFVPLRVLVPIMESIAEGNGTHNVLMKIDWNTIEKTTEDDPDIAPDKPAEQSPAADLTDSVTGIKIHADSGVLPEDTKLVVTEITSGASYDSAAAALSDVGNAFKLYDISFIDKDGNEVVPNGAVDVSFPVSSETTELALYRINADGSRILSKGEYADGYYTAKVKDFSGSYAITGAGLADTKSDGTGENTSADRNTGAGAGVNTPKTGDSLEMIIRAVIMLAAFGLAGAMLMRRKSRNI